MTIDYGIDIKTTDNTGDNSLHYAALYCNFSDFEEVIKCFKEDNLNFSVRNNNRKTPFVLACRVRRKESVQHLINKYGLKIKIIGENTASFNEIPQ